MGRGKITRLEERKNELTEYCGKVSKKGKDYDVLIPVSGEKIAATLAGK